MIILPGSDKETKNARIEVELSMDRKKVLVYVDHLYEDAGQVYHAFEIPIHLVRKLVKPLKK